MFRITTTYTKIKAPIKMTIRSSSRCHLPPCLPHRVKLHSIPWILNVKQGSF